MNNNEAFKFILQFQMSTFSKHIVFVEAVTRKSVDKIEIVIRKKPTRRMNEFNLILFSQNFSKLFNSV